MLTWQFVQLLVVTDRDLHRAALANLTIVNNNIIIIRVASCLTSLRMRKPIVFGGAKMARVCGSL